MKYVVKEFVASYLAFFARLVLRERRPRIIGVTGSVGKTTTKEAIYAALSIPAARPIIGVVGKSAGNLNTEIGLPLAVLLYDEVPEGVLGWALVLLTVPIRALSLATIIMYPNTMVLEYAADRPGDIRRLTKIARPDIAVVTAAGPAHLEKFGTVLKVAEEKSRLAQAVGPHGLVVLARDNSHTAAMARGLHAEVRTAPGRGVKLAENIAVILARHLQLPEREIGQALKKFGDLSGRLNVKKRATGILIDDTYNANPLSMELAIDTLTELAPAKARRVAILGHMAELGAETERYHIEIGMYARGRVDLLIGVGKPSLLYNAEYWYPTSVAAAEAVMEHIRPSDAILVKGSRSATMERVVVALLKQSEEGHGSHKS